jgi:hypothetical protein
LSKELSVKRSAVVVLAVACAFAVAASSPRVAASAATDHATYGFVSAGDLRASRGGPALGPLGFMPLHARDYARAKAAANAHAGLATKPSRPGKGGGGGPVISSYPNVTPSFNGTYWSGGTPPDTTGAIGLDRYIETVNTQYAIYSRAGSPVNGGSLSSLTGISGGLFGYSLSDPQIMWDAKTQRFYYSAIYYDAFLLDNGLAVGWSTTATPASSNDFCKYAITFGSELPDYPKLGDSSDFLMFGYNKFGNGASTYDGSEFTLVNKPPAGAACAPTSAFAVYNSGVLHNADSSPAATPVPANLIDDSNGAGYVVANADLSETPSANFVSIYSISTNGNDPNGIPVPSISGPTNVPVASYAMPSSAAQNGSSYLLDTLDGRFEAAVAAIDPGHGNKMEIWTAHAVFGGAGAEERWYEIDPAAGAVSQAGSVSNGSLFVWNGAISPDRANNGTTGAFGDSMAMSVSTSSTTTFPAVQFVSKRGASGQFALMNLVQANGASVDFSCSATSPCRWGDYSGASPDPTASGNVGRVWLANQYNVAGGTTSSTAWRTWIFGVTPSS